MADRDVELSPRGRLVRPYLLTRGKTRATNPELTFETVVVSERAGGMAGLGSEPERRAIVALCQTPTCLVEVAGRVRIPLGVARVIIAEMIESGHLALQSGGIPEDASTNVIYLERLLSGIRAL
ncbi:MAG: DUF742 domain-containing protein [Acidimicrobiales bacterium]